MANEQKPPESRPTKESEEHDRRQRQAAREERPRPADAQEGYAEEDVPKK
jgi:hypothetical protein